MEKNSGNNSSVELERSGFLLFHAALQGNVAMLHELLREDPLILHRPPTSYKTTILPLHIACRLGHTEFASELLLANPDLSNEVDPHNQSSPLHLAARNEHLDIVRCLVSTNRSLCFARDSQGRNPVHVAAISGRIAVLRELAAAAPAAARERWTGLGLGGGVGDTLLHLCVKQNQPEALKLLVKLMGDEAMINAKDADGNTILHFATALKHVEVYIYIYFDEKHVETIKFLLSNKRTDKNALNSDGLTPLDMFRQQNHNKDDDEINHLLKKEKAMDSKDVKRKTIGNLEKSKYFASWIADHRNSLMVVASLIAAMAFQAGLNPPGGVWQDDSKDSMQSLSPSPSPAADNTTSHTAGKSVLANKDYANYDRFLVLNTVGLVSSLSSILLLISGLPCKRVTVVIVMVAMWVAITTMAAAYLMSVLATMSDINDVRFNILISSMVSWLILMILIFFGHFLNAMVKLVILVFRLVRSALVCFSWGTSFMRS